MEVSDIKLPSWHRGAAGTERKVLEEREGRNIRDIALDEAIRSVHASIEKAHPAACANRIGGPLARLCEHGPW